MAQMAAEVNDASDANDAKCPPNDANDAKCPPNAPMYCSLATLLYLTLVLLPGYTLRYTPLPRPVPSMRTVAPAHANRLLGSRSRLFSRRGSEWHGIG